MEEKKGDSSDLIDFREYTSKCISGGAVLIRICSPVFRCLTEADGITGNWGSGTLAFKQSIANYHRFGYFPGDSSALYT